LNGCRSLEKIELPETLMKIDKHTFTYCTALKSIKIPEGVTEIDRFAFDRMYIIRKNRTSRNSYENR
jgi:hypothetical protein